MSVIKALLEKPPKLTTASKYTAVNGFIYLAVGFLLIVWPGATQTLFMDPPFVGHEAGLMRVIGLTVVVIGWLYVFGGRSGACQIVAASVIDRLIFVPAVLVPVGDGRRISASAADIRGLRRLARNRRLDSLCSQVMSALGH